MNQRKVLILFLCVMHFSAFSRKIHDARLEYSKADLYKLNGQVSIGLLVTMSNGDQKATQGYSEGKMSWSRFDVTSPYGQFEKGELKYRVEKVIDNGFKIPVHIKRGNYEADFIIQFPELKDLQLSIDNDSNRLYMHEVCPLVVSAKTEAGQLISTKKGDLGEGFFQARVNDFEMKGFDLYVKTKPFHPILESTVNVINKLDSIQVQREFEVSFPEEIILDFSASHGADGKKGGIAGADAIDGNKGWPGQNGSPGQDANDVMLFLKTDTLVKSMIVVHVVAMSGGKVEKVSQNFSNGILTIKCQGGNGGKGGNGGIGGDGRNETSDHLAGKGGVGGDGGDGGLGGKGALVVVYLDSVAYTLKERIFIDNEGGAGGVPGVGGAGGREGTPLNLQNIFLSIIRPEKAKPGVKGIKGIKGGWGGEPQYVILDSASIDSVIEEMSKE